MTDILDGALKSYALGAGIVNQQLDRERQAKMDTMTAESHQADMKAKALNTQLLQGQVDDRALADDTNYAVSRIQSLRNAMSTDPGEADRLVNDISNDPRIEAAAKKNPIFKSMYDNSDRLYLNYMKTAQVMSDAATNPEVQKQFVKVSPDGKHQSVVGAPAQQFFDLVDEQRQLSGDVAFPKNVIRDSIRLESPAGGDGFALQFDYINDKGERVPGVATKDRTGYGTPGAENDPVIVKSVPQLFKELQDKTELVAGMTMLKARAAGKDKPAMEAVDKMAVKDIEQGKEIERNKQTWDMLTQSKEYQSIAADPTYGSAIKSLAAIGAASGKDTTQFTTQLGTIVGEISKAAADEKQGALVMNGYTEAMAAGAKAKGDLTARVNAAMQAIKGKGYKGSVALKVETLVKDTIAKSMGLDIQKLAALNTGKSSGSEKVPAAQVTPAIKNMSDNFAGALQAMFGKNGSSINMIVDPTTGTYSTANLYGAIAELPTADRAQAEDLIGKYSKALGWLSSSNDPKAVKVITTDFNNITQEVRRKFPTAIKKKG